MVPLLAGCTPARPHSLLQFLHEYDWLAIRVQNMIVFRFWSKPFQTIDIYTNPYLYGCAGLGGGGVYHMELCHALLSPLRRSLLLGVMLFSEFQSEWEDPY